MLILLSSSNEDLARVAHSFAFLPAAMDRMYNYFLTVIVEVMGGW